MGGGTAQKIYFVRVRNSDQQLRILHTGLLQHTHGSAVALHRDDVQPLQTGLQHPTAGIDQGDIMFFRGQLTGKGNAHFAAADDNVHKNASKAGDFLSLYHFRAEISTRISSDIQPS